MNEDDHLGRPVGQFLYECQNCGAWHEVEDELQECPDCGGPLESNDGSAR